GGFSRGVDGEAAMNQSRRDPAAADAAEIGDEIDGKDRKANFAEAESVFAMHVVGNPEKEEPPDRIGHEFSGGDGPRLAITEQREPRNFSGRWNGVGVNEGEFLRCAARMLFGFAENEQPEDEPKEADSAGEQKCIAPAEMFGNPGNDERSDHRADACACV